MHVIILQRKSEDDFRWLAECRHLRRSAAETAVFFKQISGANFVVLMRVPVIQR